MKPTKLGTVTLEWAGQSATATLRVNRTWKFRGPDELVDLLKSASHFVDLVDHSPADGPFGPKQLRQVAEHLGDGATVQLTALPGEPAGTIY